MKKLDSAISIAPCKAFSETAAVALSLFLPDEVAGGRLELLFCIHGGSYTRKYWDIVIPGHAGYSFAEHMIAKGFAVAAIDLLGMGASSRPTSPADLDRTMIAAPSDQALKQTVKNLTDGTWARASSVSSTGVGHSIGGMIIITQQVLHRSFDRIAPLGWSNAFVALPPEARQGLIEQSLRSPYQTPQPELVRHFFYAPDVAEDVIAADEASAVETPNVLIRDALTEGLIAPLAAQIDCPVFIAQGSTDTSPNPYAEPDFYRGTEQVHLFVMRDTAHCHNLAVRRHDLWNALQRWIAVNSGSYA